jgi:hypothetical protein
MENFIEDYVHWCAEFQRNKAARPACYGLLQPLHLAYRLWLSISMAFNIELPVSDRYWSVWVIIDRFTTLAHFVPLQDQEKRATDLVKIFRKEVLRFHCLTSDIVSYRNSRFTSTIWSSLVDALDSRLKMTLPFHPHMDRQTERVNPMLQCYMHN